MGPFFSVSCIMTKRQWLTNLFGLAIAVPALSAGADYRLAGIIAPDNGRALAMLEMPDGEQHLVRTGDTIGDVMVTAVTASSVRLQLPDGELVLELAGSDAEYPDRRKLRGDSGPISIDAAAKARLRELATQAEQLETEAVARRLVSELRLSSDSAITAVNSRPVDGPAEAVTSIAQAIAARADDETGLQFVLSIQRSGGQPQRVYVFASAGDELRTESAGN